MTREYHNMDTLARTLGIESFDEMRRMIRNTPVMKEHNLVYRNLGDMQFAETGAAWGLDRLAMSFGSAFGDLDDLLRRRVAEQLTQRLFVPGDAVAMDQRDEISGRVARQRRFGEMRIG